MTLGPAPRIDVRLASAGAAGVAYLTLDNRGKLNTLDRALMIEFIATVGTLAASDDLRALVLTGAGDKAFIGGASIPEMAALDRDSAASSSRWCTGPATACGMPPVPVIARIDGYALGAGLGSGGLLRSAGCVQPREIRHAGSQSRPSLGGGGGAYPAPDRGWPCARAVAAGRDHRCRDCAGLGLGRARGRAGSARQRSRKSYCALFRCWAARPYAGRKR